MVSKSNQRATPPDKARAPEHRRGQLTITLGMACVGESCDEPKRATRHQIADSDRLDSRIRAASPVFGARENQVPSSIRSKNREARETRRPLPQSGAGDLTPYPVSASARPANQSGA